MQREDSLFGGEYDILLSWGSVVWLSTSHGVVPDQCSVWRCIACVIENKQDLDVGDCG